MTPSVLEGEALRAGLGFESGDRDETVLSPAVVPQTVTPHAGWLGRVAADKVGFHQRDVNPSQMASHEMFRGELVEGKTVYDSDAYFSSLVIQGVVAACKFERKAIGRQRRSGNNAPPEAR